jgi:hypothetical protein
MSRSQQRAAVILIVVAVAVAYQVYRQSSSRPAGSGSSFGSARLGPADIYPDPARTPGAANPDITQDNIQQTICNPRWSTKLIRPPEGYTHDLKVRQLREYGHSDLDLRDYEEDHLIPLEVGGNPTDPANLWPEAYQTSIPDGGARSKDKVENYLHDQVCAGAMSLVEAQREIATDWYRVYTMAVPH